MALSLLLRCDDVGQTRSFYRDMLGFQVTDTADGTLTVERFGGRLIFTKADLWRSAPCCSGTIYFAVDDVDALCASLGRMASLAWALQDMPYGGREFGITDCNGYCIAFRQTARATDSEQ
jgi:predicted enzyme related to lactoylglutathione lyase